MLSRLSRPSSRFTSACRSFRSIESSHLHVQCSSYEVDPTYQLKFSIVWASVAGFFILIAFPTFIRFLRKGRIIDAFTGVREDANAYEPVIAEKGKPSSFPVRKVWKARNVTSMITAPAMWTVSFIGLDLGQRENFCCPCYVLS